MVGVLNATSRVVLAGLGGGGNVGRSRMLQKGTELPLDRPSVVSLERASLRTSAETTYRGAALFAVAFYGVRRLSEVRPGAT